MRIFEIFNRLIFALVACATALGLSGCSSEMQDAVLSGLRSFSVNRAGQLSFVSNSTTEQELQCVKDNRVVLQVSAPPGTRFLCRDLSALEDGAARGPVCPGGVSIVEFPVSQSAVACTEVTVCGVPAKSRKVIGKRFDGGDIEELVFENLPWACRAKIQTSEDPSFAPENTREVMAQVVAPKCPFCARENRASCLPCEELGDEEDVRGGTVIPTTCSGAQCRSCDAGGRVIPHGEGVAFFEASSSVCRKKCSAMSVIRVCNNGLFEGPAKYNKTQCVDTACGCALPGSTTVFDSGTVKDIFKEQLPACGKKCESIRVRCDDGVWENLSDVPVPSEQLAMYSKASCVDPVCNCERPNRLTVADGTKRPVWSKPMVKCTEKCDDVKGEVQCAGGVLTAVTSGALTFASDSCQQESCGCQVTVDGSTQFIGNTLNRTLYSVNSNSVEDPDACNNPAKKVTFTCNNAVLTPTYNPAVFKYGSCQTRTFSCNYKSTMANTITGHTGLLTVYKTNSPSCDNNVCESVQLKCDNGTYKKVSDNTPIDPAFIAAYPATQCSPKQCSCQVNGFILEHNQEKDFYSKSTGECDPKACEASLKKLKCVAGVVQNGDPAVYQFESCSVKQCRCLLPSGSSINSGETLKLYAIEKATCQNTKACEEAANFASISCSNGQLTPFDQNRYKFLSCSAASCGCERAGLTVETGSTGFFYSSSAPPSGISCGEVKGSFTCGADGKFTGPSAVTNYPYASCKSDVDQGDFGGTGGGSGNDEGPGSGFRRKVGLGDGGGGGDSEGCQPGEACSQVRFYPDVQRYKRRSCVLPWGGGEIEHYASVIAFKEKCVVKPAKCTQVRQVRTCGIKGFSGSSEYSFASCEEKAACP